MRRCSGTTPDVAVDHNEDDRGPTGPGAAPPQCLRGALSEARNGLVEGWIYDNAALAGWYAGRTATAAPARRRFSETRSDSRASWASLSENRPNAGATRPGATVAGNERRKSYGQLWLIKQLLDYHYENHAAIRRLVAESRAFQRANVGPIVFRGAYPWPVFPPLPSAPDVDAPEPTSILDDPPCGYFLTAEQYTGTQPDGTVELRLSLHGITVDAAPGYLVRALGPGYFVRMTSPCAGSSDAARRAGGRADGRGSATAGRELVAERADALRPGGLGSVPERDRVRQASDYVRLEDTVSEATPEVSGVASLLHELDRREPAVQAIGLLVTRARVGASSRLRFGRARRRGAPGGL